MLQNPIHLRLEKLESWQHVTFMACLCERMYPNYAMFCKQTEFGDGQIYRRILDLIWEALTVKDAKINFDSQLEKFEEAIPSADDYDLYGVYPACFWLEVCCWAVVIIQIRCRRLRPVGMSMMAAQYVFGVKTPMMAQCIY